MNQMSGGRRSGFTAKQGQYLAFIDAYTRVHRRPPAEREMQRHFGVTPPSVHQMILTLERAGFIRRQPGVPRSIEVLVPPEDLPVLQANIQPVKTSVTRYWNAQQFQLTSGNIRSMYRSR
jgi:SOS-response transcriptional repressor LexA